VTTLGATRLTTGAKLVMPRVSFGKAFVLMMMFGALARAVFSAALLFRMPNRGCARSSAHAVQRKE